MLKAIALGALTLGASVLELGGSLLNAGRAWAETGLFGLRGWDQTHCGDACPNGCDVPISTACGMLVTENAGRWTTLDGSVYRCSDGAEE